MDVTLRQPRPREIPVSKPSAEQQYIPRALLRNEHPSTDPSKSKWLPNGAKSGVSKHLSFMDEDHVARLKMEPVETVKELDVERLEAVEDELSHLEEELDRFIGDFYVAATSFSTQASVQRDMINKMQPRRTPTMKP